MYSLFIRGFGIKRFLQVQFFSFCGFTVCVREFLQVLYVCQSLGVRSFFLVFMGLHFVLVSSGPLCLSEFGCSSPVFLVFAGLQFVLVSSGSLCLSEFGCQVLF